MKTIEKTLIQMSQDCVPQEDRNLDDQELQNTETKHPIHEPVEKKEPKTARNKKSPYLLPPFSPHSVVPLASARCVKREEEKLPPLEPLYTPFQNKPYRPPKVEESYVQRLAFYEQRDRDWQKSITRKYRKQNPLQCYKEKAMPKLVNSINSSRKIQELRIFQKTNESQK